MSETKFKKGISGNVNGRPKGSKNKFSTLKDSFIDAFKDLEGDPQAKGLLTWIKSDPENQKVFYQLVSKMLPREVSATVSIDINKYAFMPGRSIPPDVFKEYLVELIISQVIHHEIKKKMIGMVKGDFRTHQVSLKGLKGSYAQLERGGRSVIPVKPKKEDIKPLKSSPGPERDKVQKAQDQTAQTVQKKAPPKKKTPDLRQHVVPPHKVKGSTAEKQKKLDQKKAELKRLEGLLK